jgi:hypothetical protein
VIYLKKQNPEIQKRAWFLQAIQCDMSFWDIYKGFEEDFNPIKSVIMDNETLWEFR